MKGHDNETFIFIFFYKEFLLGLRSFETFRSCFRVLKIYQLENPKILIPVLSTSILVPRKNYATKLKIKFEKALNTDAAASGGKKSRCHVPLMLFFTICTVEDMIIPGGRCECWTV
jgi:hypothetical protein